MKEIIKYVFVFAAAFIVLSGCENEEELKYIDPMIEGLAGNIDESVLSIVEEESWNRALVSLRVERLRLKNIENLINTGGYSGDGYSLGSPEATLALVTASLGVVEFKMDSIFNVNLGDPFAGINDQSLGIVAFAADTYVATSGDLDVFESWLYSDSETEYTPDDVADLQETVTTLQGLAALDETEVQAFIDQIDADYAQLQADYAAAETEVTTAPEFTVAQKQDYADLAAQITAVGQEIDNSLSLDTRNSLDAVMTEMSYITGYIDNGYVSLAVEPAVYGEISNIRELRWYSEQATSEDYANLWVLTADIDAAETARWNLTDAEGRLGFRPINAAGSNSLLHFDGQYHIISGLHMTKVGGAGDADRSGVFTITGNNSSIKNLGVINVRIATSPSAASNSQGGILAGRISAGTQVENCFSEGSYAGAGDDGSGFIGRTNNLLPNASFDGYIRNCFAVADVDAATGRSSGLIGFVFRNTPVNNCYILVTGVSDVVMASGAAAAVTEGSNGIYYDPAVTTAPDIDDPSKYAAGALKFSDPGIVASLPTASWGDLANFPEYSADVWEIRTETQFDPNPRPYLKGYNYDGISDFIEIPYDYWDPF
jgi:hypothetical protein